MKESWFCRNYENGDEYQILTLFEEVFSEEESLDFWRWKFKQCAFGKGIVKLLFDRHKLVGHYAAIPVNLQIRDAIVKAIWSIDTMTHSDYRGQGVLHWLATQVYKECELKGVKFVYGFPNELIYPIRIKKLGWKGFGKMSILRKELGRDASSTILREDIFQTSEVERFETDIDLLWHKVKTDYAVIIPRTKEFLNWRFVEHPNVKYVSYVVKSSNAETLGYVVLKKHVTEKETEGHIIDILSMKNKGVVKQLLKCAYDYFVENDIKSISCWMQDNYLYADVIKEEGFIREEIIGAYPYFGVRVFDKTDTVIKDAEHFPNWYLTMGDCDVF